jgi:hypothetical protein
MRTFLSPIISLALLLLPFIVLSQQDSSRKFGISLNVNSVEDLPYKDFDNSSVYGAFSTSGAAGVPSEDKSYSLGITANYFLSQDFALRFKVSKVNRNIIETPSNNLISSYPISTQTYNDSIFTRYSFNEDDWIIELGSFYQYGFKKFCFNGGFDLKYISHSITKLVDTTNDLTFASYEDNLPKGYSYGGDVFTGIDFCPSHFISIGCEFSTALLYTKFNGTQQYTIYQNSALYNETVSKDYYSTFKLHAPTASLNISFWFNRKKAKSNRNI